MTDPLIVDCYAGDRQPDWFKLAAAGRPWVGGYVKATQGTTYRDEPWLKRNWQGLFAAGMNRNGVDWARGAYHYLDVAKNGSAQAEWYLSTVQRAGGFKYHDFPPMVDVERAGQNPIELPLAAQRDRVVNCTGDFIHRVKEATGRDVLLYGGEYLAALGITDRCGARWLAIARYTSTLPAVTYTRIGWDVKSLGLWQYCGDGEAHLANYPNEAPGCGRIDISAAVLGWDRLPELMGR